MALKRCMAVVDNLSIVTGDQERCLWEDRSLSSNGDTTSSGFSSSSGIVQAAARREVDHVYIGPPVTQSTMSAVSPYPVTNFRSSSVDLSCSRPSEASSSISHSTSHLAPSSRRSSCCSSTSSWDGHPTARSKVKVFFRVSEESDETCLKQIFQPFLDIIDRDSDVIDFINDVNVEPRKWPLVLFGGCKNHLDRAAASSQLSMPPLGLILLLKEEELVGCDRLAGVVRYFHRPPWKFHHSEWVAAHRIKAYPQNSLDYFSVADELPVCSVRQVHGSQEHLRLQLYVSHDKWCDTVELYKLVIRHEPDYHKTDFCVFTVETHRRYSIQFALKRLPQGISLSQPSHAALSFQVEDLRRLMPLLPHKTSQVSDTRWITQDLDGNDLFLEHCPPKRRHRTKGGMRPQSKSQSSRRSSAASSTFTDILLDTADEFIQADENSSMFSDHSEYSDRSDIIFEQSRPPKPHSVTGVEPSKQAISEYLSMMKTREARAKSLPRRSSPPESRKFAWIRDMIQQSDQHLQESLVGSHQHTDSGFGEERSDESDRSHSELKSCFNVTEFSGNLSCSGHSHSGLSKVSVCDTCLADFMHSRGCGHRTSTPAVLCKDFCERESPITTNSPLNLSPSTLSDSTDSSDTASVSSVTNIRATKDCPLTMKKKQILQPGSPQSKKNLSPLYQRQNSSPLKHGLTAWTPRISSSCSTEKSSYFPAIRSPDQPKETPRCGSSFSQTVTSHPTERDLRAPCVTTEQYPATEEDEARKGRCYASGTLQSRIDVDESFEEVAIDCPANLTSVRSCNGGQDTQISLSPVQTRNLAKCKSSLGENTSNSANTTPRKQGPPTRPKPKLGKSVTFGNVHEVEISPVKIRDYVPRAEKEVAQQGFWI